ncbi:hypothetical protein [Actinotalea solisilvae]|uniref:hypothetical protein n=1 Tax=Actinotalea solisilvae TaxID=2072922 RepID=UPI0018F27855|nr:hypothetical protein [Actinotalea solisilvae]
MTHDERPPRQRGAGVTRTVRVDVVPGPPVVAPRGKQARAVAIAAVFLVGLGAAGGGMVVRGEDAYPALGATFLGLAVVCGAAICLLVGPRRGRLRFQRWGGGLVLPPSRALGVVVIAGTVLCAALGAVLLGAWLTGEELGSGRRSGPVVGLLLLGLCLYGLLSGSARRGATPRVMLTPDGVSRWVGDRATVVPWDEIAEVRPHPAQVRVLVVLRRPVPIPRPLAHGPREEWPAPLELPLGLHASDPALVWAVIEHYLARPGDRWELATEVVVERVARGGLGPGRYR